MPVAADIYYHLYEGEGDDRPEQPPVVLIHGAGGSHLVWPAPLRRLRGYRVYAIDLPGHGKSGGTGQQSIQGYTRSVLDWMEAVGLHRAVFAGHSMGSAICLTLALEHPHQVLGLGLIGSSARLKVNPEILENAASQTTYLKTVDMIIERAFSPTADPRLVELAARRMCETRPSVMHGDFLACQAFDLIAEVCNITSPAVVISGVDDRMTPARFAQYLANNLPNAQLEIIPEAGHMVMLEKPEAVARILLDFLQRVSFS